ncbi:hypothetical protein U6B65_13245 [Oscillospiraceae bacterium MB08-C2-2]|nr:hypothetical protein U6B65_13245 [Oscillospiraceae bacterium MB08-C2-2]
MNETGRKNYSGYSERDMMRMQQEAEARVREMHQRAQQTVNEANSRSGNQSSGSNRNTMRNWNPGPNTQRRMAPNMSAGNSPGQNTSQQSGRGSQPNSTAPNQSRPKTGQEQPGSQNEANTREQSPPQAEAAAPKAEKTLIQGLLDSIGIDDDRLTILGLMLILLNQKADYTLILALGYLLF